MSYNSTKFPNVHFFYHDDIEQAIIETCTGNCKFPLTSKNGRVDNGYLECTTTQRWYVAQSDADTGDVGP